MKPFVSHAFFLLIVPLVLYLLILLLVQAFMLNWFWFVVIFGGASLGALTLVFGLGMAVLSYMQGLYKKKWMLWLHALSGVLGLCVFILLLKQFPPQITIGDRVFPFLSGMWSESPLKTIWLSCFYAMIALPAFFATIFGPFLNLNDS